MTVAENDVIFHGNVAIKVQNFAMLQGVQGTMTIKNFLTILFVPQFVSFFTVNCSK